MSSIRYKFEIPKPVVLLNDEGKPMLRGDTGRPEAPVSLDRYVSRYMISDPAWGKGRKARQDANLLKEICAGPTGETREYTPSLRDRIIKVLDEPEVDFGNYIMSQLEPLGDALYNAERVNKKDAVSEETKDDPED
jgi:hypothetical protein